MFGFCEGVELAKKGSITNVATMSSFFYTSSFILPPPSEFMPFFVTRTIKNFVFDILVNFRKLFLKDIADMVNQRHHVGGL